jgi:hypothetical protein
MQALLRDGELGTSWRSPVGHKRRSVLEKTPGGDFKKSRSFSLPPLGLRGDVVA